MTLKQSLTPLSSGLLPRRQNSRRRAFPFLFTLLTVVLLGNAVVGDRGLTSLIRANDQSAAIFNRIKELRAENEALREQVRELQDSTHGIEALARGELGLIEHGETVFILSGHPELSTIPEISDTRPVRPLGLLDR